MTGWSQERTGSISIWVGVAVGALLVFYQFIVFDVLQDDAFISFRYVRNFMEGHGLVFNLGERVEGYTNFFWIILLAFLAKLGLPLIETARTVGVLAAIGTLRLSAYAAQRCYLQRNWLWIAAVPFLLAANGALAYWAGSGLETGLFTFLAAAGAVTYLFRPNLSLVFVALAALTRPEGALLAFLFGIAGIILKQRSWKATLTFWGILALVLLPYAAFKWFYYGSLLPNPFHAKTGFSAEYLQSGLEYVWLFLQHYGGYGLFLILPFLFWKRLTLFSRFCLLIFAGYTLYLGAVGGDVLKAHRFFVPVLLFFSFPLMDFLYWLVSHRWYTVRVFPGIVLALAGYAYLYPLSYLEREGLSQKTSLEHWTKAGHYFANDKTVKTLALSAIGAISYFAGEKRVIDMLGLTEPAIAKNTEKIEGLISTWKERKYNAEYVLSQKPDIILFSTGFKPSAPAERALFLYPEFRYNYRPEFLFWAGRFDIYYRRFQHRAAGLKPDQPASFVNLFNEGANQIGTDNTAAIRLLRKSLDTGPKDCSVVYTTLGMLYGSAGIPESAAVYLLKGMNLDGGGSLSRYYYATLLYNEGKYSQAAEQESILIKTVPNAREFLRLTTVPSIP